MSEHLPKGWKRTTLGKLAKKLVNGGTPPTGEARYWNGKIPWITGADFTSSGLSEFRRFVSEEAASETATNVIEKGQLLIVTRTGVGKLAIAPCDVAISQDITGFYVDQEQAETEFLYHRMRQGVEDLKKLNQGTSINGIVRGDLIKYEVKLPDPKQQRLIAEILSSVDEAMEQTEALVGKLEQMKAGLMHDLFTRGVTPDGHLRPTRQAAPHLYHPTPLGWIPKVWEAATVGSCLTGIDAGKSPECPETPASGDQWGVLKVGAINPEGLQELENKTVLDERLWNPSFLVRHDDVLFSRANTSELVGAVCHVTSDPRNLMLSDKTLRLQPNLSRIYRRYLFYSLILPSTRRQIENAATGTSGSMKNIGQSSVKAIKIPRAPLDEQLRVTQRLDGVADRIATLRSDLAKLRQQKQGLMQDLLTGRVPV